MKIFKHLLLFLLCFVSSIFLCMRIFDDILVRVTTSELSYMIIRVFLTITLYSLIISISNKQIKNSQIHLISILYILCILCVTFFKGMYGDGSSGVNLNPLEIINDFNLSSNTGLLLIGNIFLYVPIGIYIKYISRTRNSVLFISFLIYCLLVEIIQYIFNLGSFDINDILFNSFGFILGVLIYEKFNTRRR